MTDYGQIYNERFIKNAPRYSGSSQARSYQDYMRNVQAQTNAANQMFGNQAQQQATQSFYQRAAGQPQGLSGGMQTQYANVVSGQQAAAAGQMQQQQYDTYAKIAQQQAQASQFARAEAAADIQFQQAQAQFESQKYAQAQAIMQDSNISQASKVDRLERLGMTSGEISRLSAPSAGPIIGGIGTLGASAASPFIYRRVEVGRFTSRVDKAILESVPYKLAQEKVTAANTVEQKAREALAKGPQPASGTPNTPTYQPAVTERQLKTNLEKAIKDVAKEKEVLKATRKEMIDNIVPKEGLNAPVGSTQEVAQKLGKELVEEGVEDVASEAGKKIVGKQTKKLAAAQTKLLAGKKGVMGALKGALPVIGGFLAGYFIVDSLMMIATGKGIIGNLSDLVKDGNLSQGGLVGAISNR